MTGKAVHERVLDVLAQGQWIKTGDMARMLGISDIALRNAIHRLRGRFDVPIETCVSYRLLIPYESNALTPVEEQELTYAHGYVVINQAGPESIRIPRRYHVQLASPTRFRVHVDPTRKIFALQTARAQETGFSARKLNNQFIDVPCKGLLDTLGISAKNGTVKIECKLRDDMIVCRPNLPEQPCSHCNGKGTIPCTT